MRRGRHQVLRALLATAYGLAGTALPIFHNAWHDVAHGRDHRHDPAPRRAVAPKSANPHVHGHRTTAAHPTHTHHAPSPTPERPAAPPSHPSDPEHGRNAPEHFGLAQGPVPVAPIVLGLARSPERPAPLRPQAHFLEPRAMPAQPRAPPSA